jgi:hypothetical protein
MPLPVLGVQENTLLVIRELADGDLRELAVFHIAQRRVVDHIKRQDDRQHARPSFDDVAEKPWARSRYEEFRMIFAGVCRTKPRRPSWMMRGGEGRRGHCAAVGVAVPATCPYR